MPTYSSTLKIDSQAFPGVQFVLRKMSEARRAEFRKQTVEVQSRLRNMNRDAARLVEELKTNAADLDITARVEAVTEAITGLVSGELNPAYVRWGLKGITGLVLENDGEDGESKPLCTADELIDDGPPELFAEICGAIQAAATMTEAELKNFALPSTSGAPMAGNALISSAANANSADGSVQKTASDISPA
ncbi:hypothetical protein [uncultured Paludibaculum sp.]|uniref:hypothetical protein n=1 Tax=uncultured Paludibaculum sp. TaxID=1765020 RepID=UPI002AAA7576|nr:hypothetical protein [uncultured Paludibaculum sp.]